MIARLFIGLVCCLISSSGAFAAKQFRAGAATSDISPSMGISINGNFTDQKGTNLHDPLHARAIVLDDGENRLAICVADSCLIYREIFEEAKKIVHAKSSLPVENILLAATHTHSAPAAVSIYLSDADKEYQHFLTLRLADAVLQAINHLAPAKIGWGVGSEPRQVFNRRWKLKPGITNKDPWGGTNDLVKMNPRAGSEDLVEPAGPIDPDVPVLALQTLDGKPIALLANYSLHYCGGVGAATYSADYFGTFCDRIQQLLGADRQDPPFVAVLSNGTSGDCNNINFREAQNPEANFARIRRVADDVAKVANSVYQKIEWHDWVPLKSVQQEIQLGVRLPKKEAVEKARLVLSNTKAPSALPEIYARETVLLSDFPAQVPVTLQVHRIGNLAISAIPCEVFAEIGLEIKKRSPFQQAFTIELANGYNGYLPTPGQHKLGGYETWRSRASYLEVDASVKIVDTITALFERLK